MHPPFLSRRRLLSAAGAGLTLSFHDPVLMVPTLTTAATRGPSIVP